MKQTKYPSNLDLSDVLDLFRKDLMLNFNCHHLGTIQSYDVTKQTCQITIDYKKEVNVKVGTNQDYQPLLVDYPLLIDCPAIVLGGGNGSLRLPIKKGDRAIVLFNDRDIDNWYEGSTNKSPRSARLHSISDGFALVGIRPQGQFLTAYEADRVELVNGQAKISLGEQKIKLENQVQSLKLILEELCDVIINLGTTGGPAAQAANTATVAAANQVKTKVGGLLE